MSGNTFGKRFRLTSFGESHGDMIGGVIDGCPAGIRIDPDYIRGEVARRRTGASQIMSSRLEPDEVRFLSGLYKNKTTGAPLAFIIENKDQRPEDYKNLEGILRPSHADLSLFLKYGVYDHRGGGRLSGRETLTRVVAGAVARLILKKEKIEIVAFVSRIGDLALEGIPSPLSREDVDRSDVRCPDEVLSGKMFEYLKDLKDQGDSTGGIVSCVIRNAPAGLGEPVFDKLDADLAGAMMSIGGAKGFELGEGFGSAAMKGSYHNDPIRFENGRFITLTNHAGGILGGISNGMDIFFNVAFKPVASISLPQETVTTKGTPQTLSMKGRHDPCIAPRAVPVVEAMAALVLVDHMFRNH